MQMLGSHNSQYFAAALSDEVKLFRAPAVPSMAPQICELVWQHKTDRVITGPMLAVSDDGKVFLGGKEGLSYVCEGERGAPRYFKVQSLFDVVMEDKQSISKIRIDCLGKSACWESTVNETSETSLMGFLKKLTTKGVNHSLYRLNLETGEQKRQATVSISEKDAEGIFQWGVSPRFRNLGWAAPDKRGNTVQLVDLEYNSEPVDWDTPAGRIERIDVNDTGHAVIHVRSDVDQLMFIGLQGKYKIVEPPPGFRVASLGRTLVLHYEMRERLDIYNLAKSELETQLDLASLRLPANRALHVTEEGSIYALLWNGTQMEVRGIFLADGMPEVTPATAAPAAFAAPPIPPDAHDSEEWATTVMSGPRVTPVAPAPPPAPTRSSIVPGRDSDEREALPKLPQPSVIPERETPRTPDALPRPAATQQFVNPPPAPRLGPPTPPPVAEPVHPPAPPPVVEEHWSMRTEPATPGPVGSIVPVPTTEPGVSRPGAAPLTEPPLREPAAVTSPPMTVPDPVVAPHPSMREPQTRATPPPATGSPPPMKEPDFSRTSSWPAPPATEPETPAASSRLNPPATESVFSQSPAAPSRLSPPEPIASYPPLASATPQPQERVEDNATGQPRGNPRSLAEIEEELTRLGLRYAAGDLSREEFLAQKAQWEGLKAFARPAPEAVAPLPLRLDLNL